MTKMTKQTKFDTFAEKYNAIAAISGLHYYTRLRENGMTRDEAIEQMFDDANGKVEREDVALLADVADEMTTDA